ncbi:type II secretion system ATPase GspE [Desulfuromonas thiophila]|uniref:type II secretion system ATPase GspE n=1 Tax=Desulfuromonas thiophila TaxID=57664 RepID=UPI0024A7F638|nr:type II secretion system ATPase GspE [Desulfuromonas thiophila]
MQGKRIGEILQGRSDLSAVALDKALASQQLHPDRRLGQLLREQGAISAEQLAAALAEQLDLPLLENLPAQISDTALLDLIPLAYARQHLLLPLRQQDSVLELAMADPLDLDAINDLAQRSEALVRVQVAAEPALLELINRSFESRSTQAQDVISDIDDGSDLSRNLEPADLLDSDDEAPVIRFVNSLITQAYKERASDIHIEPFENALVVRYRIDGLLYEVLRPPARATASISSRIKIMAGLNIAEKRLPQDGRFRVRIAGKDIDVRVSSLPTAFGERLVLRLLDKGSSVLALEDIGMEPALLAQVDRLIRTPHGVFLVTGPTGSGKTTSLYAALSRLNERDKNIITVEDPIEYQLAGVGQIQVNPKIDLTFANGLRSILRQDPDIIMVGEIRDRETAEIAIQSALTGHMVFSTLHTNDAAGALTRLVEMGIEPFLAASSIVGILAQRLVRTICPHCREQVQPPATLLRDLGVDPAKAPPFYRGRGCDRCMQIGYRGRSGIYELLILTEDLRSALLQHSDAASLRQLAIGQGMVPLRQAGLEKARQGLTSLEEVLRVTREEN